MNERLVSSYSIQKSEMNFWRKGPEDYLCMVARTLTHAIENKGGIGPFVFSCDTIGVGDVFVMRAEELTAA